MTDTDETATSQPDDKQGEPKRPMDRSPSFPYIGLTKAIERVEALHAIAKRYDTRIVDVAKPAWNLGAKSSGTLQTVAALLSFGLIESSGTGEGRKIKLSDLGYRAIADPRPGAKEQALAAAATKPKLIAEFWEDWGLERPDDAVAEGGLHFDRGFTQDGAKAFLRVYDDTVRYAEPRAADKKIDSEGASGAEAEPPGQPVAVGDFVRVEAGGQIMFERTRVRAIDGDWVFTEASQAGAKMSDVSVLEKSPAGEAAPILAFEQPREEKARSGEEMDRFTVDEGVVKITFPEGMTSASVDDLEAFFTLFIKKAKRRAGAQNAS